MMNEFAKGFVPALGTPLDENGKFVKESFMKQCQLMLDAGAVGLLAMGSMGIQANIPTSECRKVAAAAIEAAAGRVPVYVGAMDCGIVRAKERLADMEDLDVAGFVFTTPYYNSISASQAVIFFQSVAAATKHKIFLYDLPVVTQTKITYDIVMELVKTVPNLGGIKTADINMIRKFMVNPDMPADFKVFFSGLDMFDVAYAYGVTTNLDGMFTVTPVNAKKMYDALRAGDKKTGAACLTNIIALRDHMLACKDSLMSAYTAGMNLLGCSGRYNQDYCAAYSEESKEYMRAEMIRIGELAK